MTVDTIFGAVCVYLLIGLSFAMICMLIEFALPGSFVTSGNGITDLNLRVAGQSNFSTSIYYRFVTLTTLGYGDLMPVSPPARTLSYIEAVIGQIYLTVLIARLVGLHISQRK